MATAPKPESPHLAYKSDVRFQAHVPARYLPAGYTQIRPLTVRLEQDGKGYIATSDLSTMYGEGTTPVGAFHDFCDSLRDDLLWLAAHEDCLDIGLTEELKALQSAFRKEAP